MTLVQWIKSVGGDAAAARLLGVNRQRVYAWRVGRCKPNGAMTRLLMSFGIGQGVKK